MSRVLRILHAHLLICMAFLTDSLSHIDPSAAPRKDIHRQRGLRPFVRAVTRRAVSMTYTLHHRHRRTGAVWVRHRSNRFLASTCGDRMQHGMSVRCVGILAGAGHICAYHLFPACPAAEERGRAGRSSGKGRFGFFRKLPDRISVRGFRAGASRSHVDSLVMDSRFCFSTREKS